MDINQTKELWKFISDFTEKYHKEERKLPYHINLIDELRADENAHSRILEKLLKQKNSNGELEILKSFIQYLKDKSVAFENINVRNPDITQEAERIDLWIRDKSGNYAIIIENKVNYAGDQERQLERYIDKTIENGFDEKQIFILYLSPRHEEPDTQSWGEYKDEFRERYLNLAFSKDIIFWLKEKVLPNVRLKDVFLRSAVEQYIDHLEGKFDLRTINNNMNMELQEFIKEKLEFNEYPQENMDKILEKFEDIEHVKNQLYELKEDVEKEIIEYWQKTIKNKYPTFDLMEYSPEWCWAGLYIKKDKINVRVSIFEYEKELCCQLDTDHLENELSPKLKDKFITVAKRVKQTEVTEKQIWKCFPRDAYKDVFNFMEKVINEILKN